MTLHNLAYHGWTPNADLPQLGLRPGERAPGQNADGIDLLAAGIVVAEIVNTVSPGYAAEVLTPAFGMGLDGLLRSRGDRFLGILNGLDTALWDPANDRVLAAPYSRRDRAGKMACRADLLTRNGMDPADIGPVIGMIGRLDPQKGFDLLADAAPALLERGARLIVQGSGHASLADPFRALAESSPGKVAFIERFDREMARRIYAGADFFAMPSRFEPCGQGQMIALRYGTPPIVHRTGGLADTVVDVTRQPGAGTGFVFDEPTVGALLEACEAAFSLRERRGAVWDRLIDRVMAVDFDWTTGSAPKYLDAYQRAVEIRRGIAESAQGPEQSRHRLGRVDPLGRMGPTRDRDDVAGPDDRLERCDGLGADVATGRRLAADDPRVDAGGRRVPQVGEAAVPIAVLGQHGPGRRLIEIGQGLGLGADVPVGPGRLGGTDRGRRLVEVVVSPLRRIGRLERDQRKRQDRWVDQDERRRPQADGRQGGGRDGSPAVPDDLEVGRRETGCPHEGGDVGGVVAEPDVAFPVPGPTVTRLVDRDDAPPGGREGRTDPPPDGRR